MSPEVLSREVPYIPATGVAMASEWVVVGMASSRQVPEPRAVHEGVELGRRAVGRVRRRLHTPQRHSPASFRAAPRQTSAPTATPSALPSTLSHLTLTLTLTLTPLYHQVHSAYPIRGE